MNKAPLTLEELQKMRKPIPNANKQHKENLGKLEWFAVWITDRIGTMGFFLIILAWTVLWLLWNIYGPKELQFDPFPAFVLWLIISNMLQIFLMPLLMIGQNLQGKHAEVKSDADFEVNIKSEREIETILQHLENQNKSIAKILEKLEK